LVDCYVAITNVRTGEFVETTSDPSLGVYMIDMSQFMLGYVIGDILNVTATSGLSIGWAEGQVTSNYYDQIDVILSAPAGTVIRTIVLVVTDALGQTDSMLRNVTFLPVSSNWQEPVLLQPMSDYQQEASIGIDDQGNAIALWEQPYEANSTLENIGIWSARYDRAFGWGMPEKIWNGTFEPGRTTLGVGPNGQAVAAWYPEPPPYDSALYLCLFDPATGWGIPVVVQEGNGYNYGGMGADVDDSGNAMVLLAGPTGQGVTAWRHDSVLGWRGEVILSSGVAEPPQVHFDASGCALAVWDDSQNSVVRSARYVPGSGWGPVMVVSGTIGGWGSEMAVDDSGRGLATFVRYNGTAANMYGNVFDPSTGWGTPTLIGPAAGGWHPSGGSIAAAAPGEFFVVWEQRDRSAYGNNSVWSKTWNASIGWGEAIRLSDGSSYTNWMWPSIAANQNGEACVSWTEGYGTMTDVVAVRYTPGTGWGTVVTIDSSDNYSASLSWVAMDPNGDTVVIWGQSDGINDLLWGRVYLV
jgi:hypothetical protein